MGVVAADLDGDHRIDLFVANDSTVNYLYRNRGGFHFEEIGIQAGVGASVQGGYQAGMGVACGDLDADGRPNLMVTNFYGEGATLYQDLGDGLFTDRSAASGIGLATRHLLGFGIVMADVTNHGRLDVMVTNGHVDDNRPFYQYGMPSRLYENQQGSATESFRLGDHRRFDAIKRSLTHDGSGFAATTGSGAHDQSVPGGPRQSFGNTDDSLAGDLDPILAYLVEVFSPRALAG